MDNYIEGLPVAKTVKVILPGETWEYRGKVSEANRIIVCVQCPYCGEIHHHGGGNEVALASCFGRRKRGRKPKHPKVLMYRLEPIEVGETN